MARKAQRILSSKMYDGIIAGLVDRLGTDATAALWLRAERRLDALLAESAALSRGERLHAESFILPFCALYLELIEVMGRDEAFGQMSDFFADYAASAAPVIQRICAAPGGKTFFIRGFGSAVGLLFGTSCGFDNALRERSGKRIAYDVLSCPYQRITARLGVSELCQLFCRNDEICYGHIDGIRFERTGTLARGADRCDFVVSREEGVATHPRRVLVVGAGVIGCYLAHVLCRAGHDVTLVARGSWGEQLRSKGLDLHHYLQRADTHDTPRIVAELPLDEAFDAAFAVMRQDQMLPLAPSLGALDTSVVVCVGNDLRSREVEAAIHETSATPKDVLFGFQGTAGRREGRRSIVVRAGAAQLSIGPLTGEARPELRAQLDALFPGPYRLSWQHDMYWWLVSHAVAVLPFCYVAYACDCDLTKATDTQIDQLVDAVREGYDSVRAVGGMVLPEGEEAFLVPGPKRAVYTALVHIIAKTAIGRLCVTDHCKNAVSEMRTLDEGIEELFSQTDTARPTWDALRGAMPSWDELAGRWG